MTKLFEEYEFKRLVKENPQSLIGKQFRWNSSICSRSFTITKVIDDDYMEYQFEDGSTINSSAGIIQNLHLLLQK